MGEFTSNGYFYKPLYGEDGPGGYTLYNAALDATDTVLRNVSTAVTLINNWAIEDNIVTLVTATPTYVDNNTFTVPGDYTSRFTAGKVVQVEVAAGMVYSTVASSSYAAPTTTVNLNDTVLTDPITRVYVVATRDGLWPNGPGYVVAADYGSDRAALAEADALAAAAGKELRIGIAYTIDDDLTLAASVKIMPGAVLSVATTKTLAFTGGLEAGLYQVFSCTGTGKVTFAAGSNVTIMPQWWGASPSASAAVNAVAIQASLTALADYTSWTLPPGEYNCDAAQVIGSYTTPTIGVTMDFKGRMLFDGCSGLDFRYIYYPDVRGIKVKRTAQAWDVGTTTTDFGVRFGLCRRGTFGLDYIENFSYGYWLDGSTNYTGSSYTSNGYLTLNLGYLAENKYNEYCSNAGSGWNNEISYYGGQFTSNYTGIMSYTGVTVTPTNTLTHLTGWPSSFVDGFAVYVTPGLTTTTVLPTPLVQGTTYYVIAVDATTIKLATSYANAMAGTAIDITAQGTCTGISIGKAGSWGVYMTSSGTTFDNHRWYNPSFEALHNGCYLAGPTYGAQFLLNFPRFERVANLIEAAPRSLRWVQGAGTIDRYYMTLFCPRMYDTAGTAIVDIQGNALNNYSSYLSNATPKQQVSDDYGSGGISFYNPLQLQSSTQLKSVVKDYFTIQVQDHNLDHGSAGLYGHITYSYPFNKGFENNGLPGASAAPSGRGGMTYAKNAVVWNNNVAAGNTQGWVCSKSGSTVRGGTATGTGSVTGTTLEITTRGSTYMFFAGCFILIDGVQHQLKREIVPDDGGTTNAQWELFASAGDVTGVALAADPPTWVPMMNYVTTPTAPAVPASTVEQRNTNAYPVRVTVTGGTVTVIAKGPTSGALVTTGATVGAFILQPAEYIAITYSSAPTWSWTGM